MKEKSPLELWGQLGRIPINGNECIEETFEHFTAGTFREDIWHWFESHFGVRVYDLMFPAPATKE
jgi:hypothetical protein